MIKLQVDNVEEQKSVCHQLADIYETHSIRFNLNYADYSILEGLLPAKQEKPIYVLITIFGFSSFTTWPRQAVKQAAFNSLPSMNTASGSSFSIIEFELKNKTEKLFETLQTCRIRSELPSEHSLEDSLVTMITPLRFVEDIGYVYHDKYGFFFGDLDHPFVKIGTR